MYKVSSIIKVENIFKGQKIDLPEDAGIYAFWWLGNKQELLKANRKIVLKGPKGENIDVEFNDWWPPELEFPCLYVGKSTNIKKRFSLHIKRKSKGRLHYIPENNEKQKTVTTSCQLRYGIEHLFKEDENPLEIIYKKVGFSFTTKFSRKCNC